MYSTCRIHKSSSPVSFLRQTNPIYATSYLLNIHFNTILLSRFSFSKWFFPSGFLPKTCMQLSLPHTCPVPCPSHSSSFNHQSNICWGLHVIKLLVMSLIFTIWPKNIVDNISIEVGFVIIVSEFSKVWELNIYTQEIPVIRGHDIPFAA
jgi:hypothetical protein